MPKCIKPLTDLKVRVAKPRAQAYKIYDGRGLFLRVTPAGGKFWRLRYRFDGGKGQEQSLGSYPQVSLSDARAMRDRARRLLEQGVDPGA